MALVPFEMAIGMVITEPGARCIVSECPECGATGDYELLAQRVRAIQAAWAEAGRYPDTITDRAAIEQAIDAAVAAIGMESAS